MKKILFFLLFILCLPITLGFSLENTTINATGIGSVIVINDTRYVDVLNVGTNSIYFENYRLTDSTNLKITYNITEANLNINETSLPYFSDTTTILSGIDLNESVIILLTSALELNYVQYISAEGGCNKKYTFGDTIETSRTLTLPCIENGTNTLTISYGTDTSTGWSMDHFTAIIFVGLGIIILSVIITAGFALTNTDLDALSIVGIVAGSTALGIVVMLAYMILMMVRSALI